MERELCNNIEFPKKRSPNSCYTRSQLKATIRAAKIVQFLSWINLSILLIIGVFTEINSNGKIIKQFPSNVFAAEIVRISINLKLDTLAKSMTTFYPPTNTLHQLVASLTVTTAGKGRKDN
uniref:Uncharacterized protein n=1 Tax=Glossina pallidipes TaxID=7398 RepID=A0A1A9ZFC9_GLOPL